MALLFSKQAKVSFEYLISKYGFKMIHSNERNVRYESNDVFVDVIFDNERSYEVDVEIGLKHVLYNGMERAFRLGEILRLKRAGENDVYTCLQAGSQGSLVKILDRLSGLVEKYTIDFLNGNKTSFKALSVLREKETADYAIKRELARVRSKVDEAWRSKDYEKVVQLFLPVESKITPTERKKLEYAKKHMK